MKYVAFSSIMRMKKGKKPNIVSRIKEDDNFLPYVDIKTFENQEVYSYTNDEKCIECDDGDILIVCDGSRSGLVGKAIKGYVGSTLAKIQAEGVIPQYLYYFLMSKYFLLNTRKKGTGTPHLNPVVLGQQSIFVPAVEEQNRVVSRIEELFSELDEGIEELNKIKDKLKNYKLAVYSLAYDKNDILKPITRFFEITGGITKNSKRSELKIKRPYLRVANVYYNRLDLSEIKEIGVTENDIEKCTLKENDLLFVEGNGSKEQIGRVAVWDGSIKECVHQNHLIKGRPLGGMLPKYALACLISAIGRNQILEAAKSTSGLYTLSTNKIKKLQLPYCDIDEQRRRLRTIEGRLAICDSVERNVEEALRKANKMQQSILKQAFEGRI